MELVTNNFKRHIADQVQESFTETANNVYYLFIGRSTPFPNTGPAIPNPIDSVKETKYDVFKQMIGGKQITPSDINLGIRKIMWESGTVYDQYQHDVNNYENNFYVATPGAVDSYDVFKCLSNAKGSPSTYYPRLSETSADDYIYETPDGYQWKYMYTIDNNQWQKFTTGDYMPVYTNSAVSGNAINGTVDYVEVLHGGSGYDFFTQGLVQEVVTIGVDQFITIESTSSSTTDFYKNCAIKINNELRIVAEYIVTGSLRRVKVDRPFTTTPTTSDNYYISPLITLSGACCGDGTNFQARALVNAAAANSIYKVEIIDRGENFTYANVVAVGGITTVSNTAIFKAMISPKNGHGYDPAAELGAKGNIISIKFDSTLSDGKILDENDYRTFGILKDPKFANVVLDITTSTGSFSLLETIVGQTSNARGTVVTSNTTNIRLTNVSGFFETDETVQGLTSNETATVTAVQQPTIYIDQLYKLTIDDVNGVFLEDEEVFQGGTQTDKNANGALYFANSTLMYLTTPRGTFNVSDDIQGIVETVTGNTSGATAKVTGIIAKDLVDYEGEVVYIENVAPVVKNPSQTETFRIILEF